MRADSTPVTWPDILVIFNALIRSIHELRAQIDSSADSDQLFDLEEELNDYTTLLPRLYQHYSEIKEKGELSEDLKRRLRELMGSPL